MSGSNYLNNRKMNKFHTESLLLLSVYSPFSDRAGLPLHNIPSPFLSVTDIFFVNPKFYHIRLYTL